MRTSAIRCRIPNTIEWLRFKVQNSHDVVLSSKKKIYDRPIDISRLIIYYYFASINMRLLKQSHTTSQIGVNGKRRQKKYKKNVNIEVLARNTHSETETDTCLIKQYPEWMSQVTILNCFLFSQCFFSSLLLSSFALICLNEQKFDVHSESLAEITSP